eukprot:g45793.t1
MGPDNILATVLKTCAPELAAPLNKLFQQSYNTDICPTMWKIVHLRFQHYSSNQIYLQTPKTRTLLCPLQLDPQLPDSQIAISKDSKTKELIIDLRKQSEGHAPVCVNGTEVELVKSFKFLG